MGSDTEIQIVDVVRLLITVLCAGTFGRRAVRRFLQAVFTVTVIQIWSTWMLSIVVHLAPAAAICLCQFCDVGAGNLFARRSHT